MADTKKLTLGDDFNVWWDMPRYVSMAIPARQMAEVEVLSRHGSNKGWPGPERNVKYWVTLANGWAVGIITPDREASATTAAQFPYYPLKVT